MIGIGAPGKFIADAGLDIELYDNMPHDDFKRFLLSLDNAIGLIPLDDSKFSSCKSEIKFVDYSLCNIVSVCSSVPPYSDTVLDKQTGFLVNNDTESWYKAILILAKSKEMRIEVAQVAKKHCLENYAMEKSADKWQELFESMKLQKIAFSRNYLIRQKRIYRAKLITSHLFDKTSFSLARDLVSKYGFLGFVKRFAIYFFK